MGCFLACFGTSKHRKSRRSPNEILSGDQVHETHEALQPTKPMEHENVDKPINPIIESKDKHKQLLNSSIRKKVTFDLNVKTYEELPTQEIENCFVESEEEKERGNKTETQNESQTLWDSSVSSIVTYPSNHRYHNCTSREYECGDMDLEESDSDGDGVDEDDDFALVQEESSESLFSLSIESRKQSSAAEMGEREVNSPITIPGSSFSTEFREQDFAVGLGGKEVNSSRAICGLPDRELKSIGSNQNARDRSQYVHSVLNPVENLTQWKAVKARTTPPPKHQEKENINIEQELNIPFSEEPSFNLSIHNSKQQSKHPKPEDQEIAVDTSLSSWLVVSEMTPVGKISPNSIGNSPSERVNSSRSYQDRPILGALTFEELKKLSASSSPRRSLSHSPNEIPIIGTVGSYWSHTRQAMDSDSSSSSKGMSYTSTKYKEEKRVAVYTF